MYFLDIFEFHKAPKAYPWVPTFLPDKIPLPTMDKGIHPASSPMARSTALCKVLNLMGFTSLPAHRLFKQDSHNHLQEAGAISPASYYKAYTPQPLLVHSTAEGNLPVAPHGNLCSPSPDCENMD